MRAACPRHHRHTASVSHAAIAEIPVPRTRHRRSPSTPVVRLTRSPLSSRLTTEPEERSSSITRTRETYAAGSAAERDIVLAHPANNAVERYYTLLNEKNWSGLASLFDLPTPLVFGQNRVLLDSADATVAAFQGLWQAFQAEGVARVTWDVGSFGLFLVHPHLALVKTVITREGADATRIRTWNCSYTMRCVRQEWLISFLSSDE
jgi:hypothetical protein